MEQPNLKMDVALFWNKVEPNGTKMEQPNLKRLLLSRNNINRRPRSCFSAAAASFTIAALGRMTTDTTLGARRSSTARALRDSRDRLVWLGSSFFAIVTLEEN